MAVAFAGVLLDENLPLDLAAEIRGHEVNTVRGLGWTGTENGELMRLAATGLTSASL